MAKVPETIQLRGGAFGNNEDEKKMAHSLWAMSKDPANAKWKSPKQGEFFLNFYKRYGEKHRGKPWETSMEFPTWANIAEVPKDTEMIFYVELTIAKIGERDFGRKSRRAGRLMYFNRNGLLRYDKVKFFYKDSGPQSGQSGIDSVEIGQPTGIDSSGLEPIVDKKPQWQVDKETIQAASQYVGQPGDKMQEDLTLMTVLGPYDSQWGDTFITLFKDDKNNQYVYFGQEIGEWAPDRSSFNRMVKGNKATIKFTVKKHTERDGTKQTVISRPKIVGGLKEEKQMSSKRPIFEKYQALYESKQVEQISRSLGYLISIASEADKLRKGIEEAEPMLNKKLVKRLAATLHVISKIKAGDTPNEAPLTDEPSTKGSPKDDETKETVDESEKYCSMCGVAKGQEHKDWCGDEDNRKLHPTSDERAEMDESHMGELASEIDLIPTNPRLTPSDKVAFIVQQLRKNPKYANVPELEKLVFDYVRSK